MSQSEHNPSPATLRPEGSSLSSNSQKATAHTPGPFELDHATDDGTRHFIVHGELPKGLNASYGYPICDSLNRHHCVSPEEDEANGHLLAASWDMLQALKGVWELLTPGQQGCAKTKAEAQTPVVIPYSKLADIFAAIAKAQGGTL